MDRDNVIDNLYHGYVLLTNKGEGKSPQSSYKNINDLMTLDSALSSGYGFGGVLKDDVILVDIDDPEQSDILYQIIQNEGLNCYVYKTTRGKHFLFKYDSSIGLKCSSHVKSALDLVTDYKVGSSSCYQVLKRVYKDRINRLITDERKLIYSCDYKEMDQLPKWLYPVKSNVNLFGLSDGEGRNHSLYKYVMVLASFGFNYEEIKKTIELINRYIFKQSLDTYELNQILRPDSIDGAMNKVKIKSLHQESSNSIETELQQCQRFYHDLFAHEFMELENIKKIDGVLHIYHDGYYSSNPELIESKIIEHSSKYHLKETQRKEVIKYMNLVCDEVKQKTEIDSDNYIGFKNGIYEISTATLKNHNPNMIITNLIPHNFNENAKSEIVDSFLDSLSCNNRNIRLLLEESIGYSFIKSNDYNKFFILKGDRGNGKSTFLNIIKALLGEENCSSLDIKQIGERFSTETIMGKLVNLGGDIVDDCLSANDISIIKNITGGDAIKGEIKHGKVFYFTPTLKLFFNANNIPRTKDPTGAILRRMIIIPLNARFTDDNTADPTIKKKIIYDKNSMEYLIQLGIKGMERVRKNNGFTECEEVKEQIIEYEKSNNHVVGWVDELRNQDVLISQPIKNLYQFYVDFCKDANYKPESRTNFSRIICSRYGYKTQSRNAERYFYQKE